VKQGRILVAIGALLAAVGVAAGAFGAHGLEGLVSDSRLETFDTGVRYHLIHAVALVAIGSLVEMWQVSSTRMLVAGHLLVVGVFIFSGSLYLLVLTDTPWLGAITPLGGVSLILGWCLFAWSVWTHAHAGRTG
jgi:uncharacterized membrane protein YgdD (TMEM256/DUF423 family)